MEENLPKMSSTDFVKCMELNDTFHFQELLSKMELLKGKIELYKKWTEPC